MVKKRTSNILMSLFTFSLMGIPSVFGQVEVLSPGSDGGAALLDKNQKVYSAELSPFKSGKEKKGEGLSRPELRGDLNNLLRGNFQEKLRDNGWTSSGGGSGVVCFDRLETAQAADKYLENNQPLPLSFSGKIKTVEALDYYEAAKKLKQIIRENFVQEAKADQWAEVFNSLLQKTKWLSPLFGLLLEETSLQKKMRIEEWKEVSTLPFYNDQFARKSSQEIPMTFLELKAEIKKKTPFCRPVQVALRHSRSQVSSLKSSGMIPDCYFEFEVQYVKMLFEKMDPLNKALLYLHENLYLLGQPLGHPSSAEIRYWVREIAKLKKEDVLYSEEFKFIRADIEYRVLWKVEKQNNNTLKGPFELQHMLNAAFGDYALYFLQDRLTPAQGKHNRHYEPFISLLQKVRLELQECLHRQGSGNKNTCFKNIIHSPEFIDGLDGSEALIYFAWFYYGTYRKNFNYEYLVTPEENAESYQQTALARIWVCKELAVLKDLDETKNSARIRALRYCDTN